MLRLKQLNESGADVEPQVLQLCNRVSELEIGIESFTASDFGVPPDERHQTYRFPVIVALDSQQFRMKSGQELPLQVGMSLTANIKLRKVTYLQLLLGGFQDKANSLRRL